MVSENETMFRCPRCGYRGEREELENEEGLCPACGMELFFLFLETKRHHLHEKIRVRLDWGLSIRKVAKLVGCSPTTVFKVRKKYYG